MYVARLSPSRFTRAAAAGAEHTRKLSMAIPAVHAPSLRLVTVEDYESLVGTETVERILEKATRLRDLHVAHVNSTYYGGGVAELLSSLTLLMNGAGIKTGWRLI